MMRKPIFPIMLIFTLTITPIISGQKQQIHTAKSGETLSQIAVLYGVDIGTLATINAIQNINTIQQEQVLVIPSQNTTTPRATTSYTVQPGDNLQIIADRFNTTIKALALTNSLANPNHIERGQVLTLPSTGGTTNTTRTLLRTAPPVLPRHVVNGYYRVQSGDTMFTIAQNFNVNIYDIAEANGLLNLNLIYAGQSLRIPGY